MKRVDFEPGELGIISNHFIGSKTFADAPCKLLRLDENSSAHAIVDFNGSQLRVILNRLRYKPQEKNNNGIS